MKTSWVKDIPVTFQFAVWGETRPGRECGFGKRSYFQCAIWSPNTSGGSKFLFRAWEPVSTSTKGLVATLAGVAGSQCLFRVVEVFIDLERRFPAGDLDAKPRPCISPVAIGRGNR